MGTKRLLVNLGTKTEDSIAPEACSNVLGITITPNAFPSVISDVMAPVVVARLQLVWQGTRLTNTKQNCDHGEIK